MSPEYSCTIAFPWRSIVSQTARFSSSLVTAPLVILPVPAMKASPMPDNAGRAVRTPASRPDIGRLQDFSAARPGTRGGFGGSGGGEETM